MTAAPCPQCGTNTIPGLPCVACGTPTPAPIAAPAGDPYIGQWEAILTKLQAVAAPKYVVKGILGYGGMAGVYLADEPRLGRKVAIKVMAPGLMVDPKLVERFEQEARTIAQLSHPNIVTIYEVDERDSLHWFTMTYVAGRTLGQVLHEALEPLPIPVVGAWLYQVGDALAFAHNHGIVHRDVKPGNVLIDLRGNALVTDFGIAKVADSDSALTRTGMLVGTPAYMSPEQCSSGAISGASDQYALATVAYQMLTGQPPFAGATLAVLQAHLTVEPTPVRELRPDCPEPMAHAIERMLQKNPEDRWESVSAAVQAMAAAPAGLEGPLREQLKLLAALTVTVKVPVFPEFVQEGSREHVHVLLHDSSGKQLPARRIEWTSSDPTVAVVTADHTLQALSPGTAYIGAYTGPASLSLRVTVAADPVRAIKIPEHKPIAVGESRTLEAEVLDIDDSPLPARAVLWTSSDPKIATVTPDGVVQGVAPGSVTVTACTGGRAAELRLVVAPVKRADRTSMSTAAVTHATSVRAVRAKSLPGTTPAAVTQSPNKRKVAVIAGAAVSVIALIAAVVILKPAGEEQGTASGQDNVENTVSAPPGPVAPTGDPNTKPPEQAAAPAVVDADPTPAAAARQTQPQTQTPTQTQQPQPTAAQPVTTLTGEIVLQAAAGLPEGSTLTVTDGSGTRVFDRPRMRLDAGRYVLEFNAPGYTTDLKTITLRAGETETWSPVLVKIAAPAPPVEPQRNPVTPPVQTPPDTRADESAIQTRVNEFIASFSNRDRGVLGIIPPQETALRAFITERSVSNLRASTGSPGSPVITNGNATISFTMNVSFRADNENQTLALPLVARLEKTTRGWELLSVRSPRN